MKEIKLLKNILRYFRLYKSFVTNCVTREMEFRGNLALMFFLDAVWYTSHVIGVKILFSKISSIGGLTENEMLFFLATMFVLDAFEMCVSNFNCWELPELIRTGAFDFYLIRPISSIFLSCFRYFSLGSVGNLIASTIFLIYTINQLPVEITFLNTFIYFAFLVNGYLVRFALKFIFILPTFVIIEAQPLQEIRMSVEKFMENPDVIYQGFLRKILTYIVPYTLVISFPVRSFIREIGIFEGLLSFGTGIGFILIFIFLWGKAVKVYGSASS
ncbi:ABC-2 family transporter protein [bacterium]|nr:ABC-2 family transporter protein [bacterium]